MVFCFLFVISEIRLVYLVISLYIIDVNLLIIYVNISCNLSEVKL